MKFHHCWPPPGKILSATPGKIHYCPPWKKILTTPMAELANFTTQSEKLADRSVSFHERNYCQSYVTNSKRSASN